DGHGPFLPRIRSGPLAGVAHTGQPRDRIRGVAPVPHVLHAVRVAAVRRRIEGLDHGASVGDDLASRRRDGGDPSMPVGSGLPVVPDVGLIPRTVGEMAVAVGPDPALTD